jgi:hypothetical protein
MKKVIFGVVCSSAATRITAATEPEKTAQANNCH